MTTYNQRVLKICKILADRINDSRKMSIVRVRYETDNVSGYMRIDVYNEKDTSSYRQPVRTRTFTVERFNNALYFLEGMAEMNELTEG